MADDETVLVCVRVVDLPIPPVASEIQICTGGCLERVWVAHSSPRGIRPVCPLCAAQLLADDPDPKFCATKDQVREVARWLKAQRR